MLTCPSTECKGASARTHSRMHANIHTRRHKHTHAHNQRGPLLGRLFAHGHQGTDNVKCATMLELTTPQTHKPDPSHFQMQYLLWVCDMILWIEKSSRYSRSQKIYQSGEIVMFTFLVLVTCLIKFQYCTLPECHLCVYISICCSCSPQLLILLSLIPTHPETPLVHLQKPSPALTQRLLDIHKACRVLRSTLSVVPVYLCISSGVCTHSY